MATDRNNGWIKLHRKCLQHWLYNEPRPHTRREAWEDMLLLCNHEDASVLIQGELISCKRGQSVLSLSGWARQFKWSIQQVRTFFNILEKDEMIETEGLHKSTRLTICNYDIYQECQQTDNKQITSKEQADNKQITTNKNEKNEKNDKNINTKEKNIKKESPEKTGKSVIPPTPEMVDEYCRERGNNISGDVFCDYYTARGWLIGKSKMKDWQAAVRTWEKNRKDDNRQPGLNFSGNNSRTTGAVDAEWMKQQGYVDEFGNLKT